MEVTRYETQEDEPSPCSSLPQQLPYTWGPSFWEMALDLAAWEEELRKESLRRSSDSTCAARMLVALTLSFQVLARAKSSSWPRFGEQSCIKTAMPIHVHVTQSCFRKAKAELGSGQGDGPPPCWRANYLSGLLQELKELLFPPGTGEAGEGPATRRGQPEEGIVQGKGGVVFLWREAVTLWLPSRRALVPSDLYQRGFGDLEPTWCDSHTRCSAAYPRSGSHSSQCLCLPPGAWGARGT